MFIPILVYQVFRDIKIWHFLWVEMTPYAIFPYPSSSCHSTTSTRYITSDHVNLIESLSAPRANVVSSLVPNYFRQLPGYRLWTFRIEIFWISCSKLGFTDYLSLIYDRCMPLLIDSERTLFIAICSVIPVSGFGSLMVLETAFNKTHLLPVLHSFTFYTWCHLVE